MSNSVDKTLPYCLNSKKDIIRDHTLSFEEDNVILESSTHSIRQEYIESIISGQENKSTGHRR